MTRSVGCRKSSRRSWVLTSFLDTRHRSSGRHWEENHMRALTFVWVCVQTFTLQFLFVILLNAMQYSPQLYVLYQYCRTHKSRRVMTPTPLLSPFLPLEEITSIPCQLFFVWSPLVFFPSLLSFFTCHFTSLSFFTMKIIHLLKWITSYIIGLWRPPIVLSLVHRWSCPSTGKPINN